MIPQRILILLLGAAALSKGLALMSGSLPLAPRPVPGCIGAERRGQDHLAAHIGRFAYTAEWNRDVRCSWRCMICCGRSAVVTMCC